MLKCLFHFVYIFSITVTKINDLISPARTPDKALH